MTAPPEPVGTVHVVDPSPLNWLFITWNTMEEPIRIDEAGRVVYSLAESSEWLDERTLELELRRGVRFQDGEHFTAHNIKQNFDEMQRWAAPHPPGTWLNFPAPESTAEVVDDHTLRFHFPGPDGLAIGKFRGFHIASSAFWNGKDAPGFGYKKFGSGEGHWQVIDEPGPWGTGPFTLVQGASSITTRPAIMNAAPFRASSIIESEQRDPQVVLEANLDHWNRAARGPRIERAVFRNDLTPDEALRLVCDTEGEVDILTEVSPADAQRVLDSEHARLVVSDANRVLVGILNRGSDAPLHDVEVRRALNRAIDRQAVVDQGLNGYASVIPAMTPPWCSGFPADVRPYELDTARAREAFAKAGWPARRPLRIATPESFAAIAHVLAASIRSTLDLMVEVVVVPPDQLPAGSRALIEKQLDLPWDVLLHPWFDLSSEAPPAAVHREFFGLDGAFRAGPPDDGFDALFDEMKVQLDGEALVEVAERIDAYVHDQALALFICAPQALYAVNEHVTFSPYKTTFELAEVTVDEQHWSVSGGRSDTSGRDLGDRTAIRPTTGKPTFSQASGNAC